jgi:hypothetical protein
MVIKWLTYNKNIWTSQSSQLNRTKPPFFIILSSSWDHPSRKTSSSRASRALPRSRVAKWSPWHRSTSKTGRQLSWRLCLDFLHHVLLEHHLIKLENPWKSRRIGASNRFQLILANSDDVQFARTCTGSRNLYRNYSWNLLKILAVNGTCFPTKKHPFLVGLSG